MSSYSFKLSLLVAACVALFAASHVDAECSGPEAYGDFYAVEQKAEGLTPKLENGARKISSSFLLLPSPPLPLAFPPRSRTSPNGIMLVLVPQPNFTPLFGIYCPLTVSHSCTYKKPKKQKIYNNVEPRRKCSFSLSYGGESSNPFFIHESSRSDIGASLLVFHTRPPAHASTQGDDVESDPWGKSRRRQPCTRVLVNFLPSHPIFFFPPREPSFITSLQTSWC